MKRFIEDLRWIRDVYEADYDQAFVLYFYFKWRRWKDRKAGYRTTTMTIYFDI